MKAKSKRNPPDLTGRNARASKKRDQVLADRLKKIEQRLRIVEGTANWCLDRIR